MARAPSKSRPRSGSGTTRAAPKTRDAMVAAPARPTRSTTKKSAQSIPRELTTPDEHPVVAKAKASLAKRFRATRSDSIEDGVTIAYYLLALGRDREAAALARSLADLVEYNDRNITLWCAAGDAICLAARLARLAGDEQTARALIARLVEHSAFSDTSSQREIKSWIADADRDLKDARAEKSATWARLSACCALERACYFRETAGHGFYYDKWVDHEALDKTIAGALEVMRARLG